MKKALVKTALATALVFGSAVASAAPVNPFDVKPSNLGGTYSAGITGGEFTADLISGIYTELVTLTDSGAGTGGTFSYSLFWQGQNFVYDSGNVQGCGTLFQVECTGLQDTYSLYATLKGTGLYSVTGSGTTATVDFFPDLGGLLQLFAASSGLDPVAPADGTGDFTFNTAPTDPRLLLQGNVIAASGRLEPNTGTDFGSFGVITTAALVAPDGENFFTGPRPFYNISFEAGNFNSYFLTSGPPAAGEVSNATVGGQAQVTFGTVPEPSAIALAGLALVAAGLAGRRRTRSA